jgi:hypothetical protein
MAHCSTVLVALVQGEELQAVEKAARVEECMGRGLMRFKAPAVSTSYMRELYCRRAEQQTAHVPSGSSCHGCGCEGTVSLLAASH